MIIYNGNIDEKDTEYIKRVINLPSIVAAVLFYRVFIKGKRLFFLKAVHATSGTKSLHVLYSQSSWRFLEVYCSRFLWSNWRDCSFKSGLLESVFIWVVTPLKILSEIWFRTGNMITTVVFLGSVFLLATWFLSWVWMIIIH